MAAKKAKTKTGLRRFNVDFPYEDIAAFRKVAAAKGVSMAEWARGVLRKAAGR